MLYSRHDVVDLVHREAPELQNLLISMIWHLSRGNQNEICDERFGLLQVPLRFAREIGFQGHQNELLDPECNIQIGAQLLNKFGLLQYCGREFAHALHSILNLERYLNEQSDVRV
jgi:soluble lytic murein transglycosylase-like protein